MDLNANQRSLSHVASVPHPRPKTRVYSGGRQASYFVFCSGTCLYSLFYVLCIFFTEFDPLCEFAAIFGSRLLVSIGYIVVIHFVMMLCPLQDKMAGLSRELLGRKASYVLPVDTLCLELQQIADAFHDAGGSVRFILVNVNTRAQISGAVLIFFSR